MLKRKSVIKTLSIIITALSITNTVTFAAENYGWQKTNGEWIYVDSTGNTSIGWQYISNKWYYFDNNGSMATGWKSTGDHWYYLEPSGEMATGWKKLDNQWYYLEPSGAMITGWKKLSDEWYYFESSGEMVTGWKFLGGSWYYLKNTGEMATGSLQIDGVNYYFDSNGVWSNKQTTSMKVEATAYTGYSTTSTGQKPVWGTIAVDPKVIPYGTKVYIPYFDQVFIANNTGGAIKGNKIDIFMNTSQDCKNWGRRTIDIEILG